MLHTFEYFTIMMLTIINYDKITKSNENAEFIIKIFIILLPIFTLFRGYSILTREKDYFTITYAIILLYLCEINQRKYSGIIQLCTIGLCLMGYTRFITQFDEGSLMPYKSYLTQEDITIMEEY